jgi:hypothetical protein
MTAAADLELVAQPPGYSLRRMTLLRGVLSGLRWEGRNEGHIEILREDEPYEQLAQRQDPHAHPAACECPVCEAAWFNGPPT